MWKKLILQTNTVTAMTYNHSTAFNFLKDTIGFILTANTKHSEKFILKIPQKTMDKQQSQQATGRLYRHKKYEFKFYKVMDL